MLGKSQFPSISLPDPKFLSEKMTKPSANRNSNNREQENTVFPTSHGHESGFVNAGMSMNAGRVSRLIGRFVN